jgi:hypothetical protein
MAASLTKPTSILIGPYVMKITQPVKTKEDNKFVIYLGDGSVSMAGCGYWGSYGYSTHAPSSAENQNTITAKIGEYIKDNTSKGCVYFWGSNHKRGDWGQNRVQCGGTMFTVMANALKQAFREVPEGTNRIIVVLDTDGQASDHISASDEIRRAVPAILNRLGGNADISAVLVGHANADERSLRTAIPEAAMPIRYFFPVNSSEDAMCAATELIGCLTGDEITSKTDEWGSLPLKKSSDGVYYAPPELVGVVGHFDDETSYDGILFGLANKPEYNGQPIKIVGDVTEENRIPVRFVNQGVRDSTVPVLARPSNIAINISTATTQPVEEMVSICCTAFTSLMHRISSGTVTNSEKNKILQRIGIGCDVLEVMNRRVAKVKSSSVRENQYKRLVTKIQCKEKMKQEKLVGDVRRVAKLMETGNADHAKVRELWSQASSVRQEKTVVRLATIMSDDNLEACMRLANTCKGHDDDGMCIISTAHHDELENWDAFAVCLNLPVVVHDSQLALAKDNLCIAIHKFVSTALRAESVPFGISRVTLAALIESQRSSGGAGKILCERGMDAAPVYNTPILITSFKDGKQALRIMFSLVLGVHEVAVPFDQAVFAAVYILFAFKKFENCSEAHASAIHGMSMLINDVAPRVKTLSYTDSAAIDGTPKPVPTAIQDMAVLAKHDMSFHSVAIWRNMGMVFCTRHFGVVDTRTANSIKFSFKVQTYVKTNRERAEDILTFLLVGGVAWIDPEVALETVEDLSNKTVRVYSRWMAKAKIFFEDPDLRLSVLPDTVADEVLSMAKHIPHFVECKWLFELVADMFGAKNFSYYDLVYRLYAALKGWRDVADYEACGSFWELLGNSKPVTGKEIVNHGLSAALKGVQNTKAFEAYEWSKFNIDGLLVHHYIESDGLYYRPAKRASANEHWVINRFVLASSKYRRDEAGVVKEWEKQACTALVHFFLTKCQSGVVPLFLNDGIARELFGLPVSRVDHYRSWLLSKHWLIPGPLIGAKGRVHQLNKILYPTSCKDSASEHRVAIKMFETAHLQRAIPDFDLFSSQIEFDDFKSTRFLYIQLAALYNMDIPSSPEEMHIMRIVKAARVNRAAFLSAVVELGTYTIEWKNAFMDEMGLRPHPVDQERALVFATAEWSRLNKMGETRKKTIIDPTAHFDVDVFTVPGFTAWQIDF